jgi:hypothetical protein
MTVLEQLLIVTEFTKALKEQPGKPTVPRKDASMPEESVSGKAIP